MQILQKNLISLKTCRLYFDGRFFFEFFLSWRFLGKFFDHSVQPISVSDWLIFCCGNWILPQKRNENDERNKFYDEKQYKECQKINESSTDFNLRRSSFLFPMLILIFLFFFYLLSALLFFLYSLLWFFFFFLIFFNLFF